jgi:hypothetical protein
MEVVYVVQHVHIINDDEEDVKMIGVYATKQLAQEAVERLCKQPGFCETTDGFHIDPYDINKDHWTEGFVTDYR